MRNRISILVLSPSRDIRYGCLQTISKSIIVCLLIRVPYNPNVAAWFPKGIAHGTLPILSSLTLSPPTSIYQYYNNIIIVRSPTIQQLSWPWTLWLSMARTSDTPLLVFSVPLSISMHPLSQPVGLATLLVLALAVAILMKCLTSC